MKQVTRCEFGGGLSEVHLNRLIIKLIKKNIRIPSESRKDELHAEFIFFLCINKHRPATWKCEQGGALFVCSMKSFERFAQDF